MQELVVVGAGHAASCMARLWHDAGAVRITQVCNRSLASAEAAVDFIGAGSALAQLAPIRVGTLVMVGVNDSALALAAATLLPHLQGASIVFHLSGARSSELLTPLRAAGAHLASLHPLASFADRRAMLGRFAGTPCALEGDREALSVLSALVEVIGGRCLSISAERKLAYHAGAVFASNYLTCLIDAACEAYRQAGIDEAQALTLVRPLMEGTLANALAHGARAALSGPIVRGDLDLVRDEADALTDLDLAGLYRLLARRAARMIDRPDPFAESRMPTGGA